MITARPRRRTTAALPSLSAVLATTTPTAPTTAAPARTAARATAPACPRFDDRIKAGCESNPHYRPWH
ncbi:hypothetical protein ACFY0A_08175 [Streptomyces sp. NPDC001698]|uniref:hypothetical protein n=1 Tax=unclassified Streptomyces TaxID=2593676 RepID=UPI0036B2F395